MTITIPTSADVAAILDKTGLSSKEFGEAIGYGDAERVTRALVRGERHKKPYAMSATAAHALAYMQALARLVVAHAAYRINQTPETDSELASAHLAATEILPARLKPE